MSSNFNEEYAAKTPKSQWVKEHEHLKEEFDLSAEWESAQPKKEVKEDKK